MKRITLHNLLDRIFYIGITITGLTLGYAMFDNIVLHNPINNGLVGISVTVLLGTIILMMNVTIEYAKKIFEKHGLDWKKEVLEKKL